MGNTNSPSPYLGVVRAQIVNDDKTPTFALLKLLGDWDSRLTKGLNQIGEFIGSISPAASIGGRPEGIGTTVQNLDSAGVVTAAGVDFARTYANKTTDHIADGTGSPLSGGKVAHAALVTSDPSTHNSLVFDGTNWNASSITYSNLTGAPTLPANTPAVVHQWMSSYNAATGAFTEAQPDFSDISGTLTTAQLPGLTVVITTAKLTVGGTNGSMTFVGGLLTALVQAT